jgi:hypothetical protein
MDPNAEENLDHWSQLHDLYPNGVCPLKCNCMGDGWYAMCDNLEALMERFHQDIDDWNAVGSTSPPPVPTKTHMMNVAGRSYWCYREDKDNAVDHHAKRERIFQPDLPLPPCVHNQMSENIDLILLDLQKMFVDKVEHDISPLH